MLAIIRYKLNMTKRERTVNSKTSAEFSVYIWNYSFSQFVRSRSKNIFFYYRRFHVRWSSQNISSAISMLICISVSPFFTTCFFFSHACATYWHDELLICVTWAGLAVTHSVFLNIVLAYVSKLCASVADYESYKQFFWLYVFVFHIPIPG